MKLINSLIGIFLFDSESISRLEWVFGTDKCLIESVGIVKIVWLINDPGYSRPL